VLIRQPCLLLTVQCPACIAFAMAIGYQQGNGTTPLLCLYAARHALPGTDWLLLALQAVAELMYDTALVTSGFSVDNPREFAQRIYSMVGLAVNADPAKADAAASTSSAGEPVDAEVVAPSDPWKSS